MSSREENRKVGVAFGVAIAVVLVLSATLLLNSKALIEWLLQSHGLKILDTTDSFAISSQDYSNFVRTILELVSASLGVVFLLVFTYYVVNKRQEESIARTETTQKIDLINQVFSEAAEMGDQANVYLMVPIRVQPVADTEADIPEALGRSLNRNLAMLNAASQNTTPLRLNQLTHAYTRDINGSTEGIHRRIDLTMVDQLATAHEKQLPHFSLSVDGSQYDWISQLTGPSNLLLLQDHEAQHTQTDCPTVELTYALLVERAYTEKITNLISKSLLIIKADILTRAEAVILLDSLNVILNNHHLWTWLIHRSFQYRKRGERAVRTMSEGERELFFLYTENTELKANFMFSRELREFMAILYLKALLESQSDVRRLRWQGLLARSVIFEFFIKSELSDLILEPGEALEQAYLAIVNKRITPILLELKTGRTPISQTDIDLCSRQILSYYFVIRRTPAE